VRGDEDESEYLCVEVGRKLESFEKRQQESQTDQTIVPLEYLATREPGHLEDDSLTWPYSALEHYCSFRDTLPLHFIVYSSLRHPFDILSQIGNRYSLSRNLAHAALTAERLCTTWDSESQVRRTR
jgi:hypothetical protein